MKPIRKPTTRSGRRGDNLAKRSRRFPRRVAVVIACVALAVGVSYGCYLWLQPRPPEPPVADLTDAHAEVGAAVTAARKHAKQNPRSVSAWADLGMLLYGRGFFAEASASFVELERLDSGNHCRLGWCLEVLGDRSGALEAYRNAVRYKPDYGEGHKKLGSLLARLGRDMTTDTRARETLAFVRYVPADSGLGLSPVTRSRVYSESSASIFECSLRTDSRSTDARDPACLAFSSVVLASSFLPAK